MPVTHDELPVQTVQLEPVCTLDIEFAPVPSFRTPTGTRLLFSATGGTAAGPMVQGTVVPGSADWLVLGDDMVARVDVRAVIRTEDGAYIQMTNTGRVSLGEHLSRFLEGNEVQRRRRLHPDLPDVRHQ